MYTKYSAIKDQPIAELEFSIVDTETTGMFPAFNRVMDIGIVKIKDGKVIEEYEALIDPEQEIPYFITGYTKLYNHNVRGKPKFKDIITKVEKLLNGSVFVGHNALFDYGFLFHEMKRHQRVMYLPTLCTVKLGRKLHPELSAHDLDTLSNHYGIEIENRHRALPDAKATAIIFLELVNKIRAILGRDVTFRELEKFQENSFRKREIDLASLFD